MGSEKENGTEPKVARSKQLIIGRINKIPLVDSAEEREAYLQAANYYQKQMKEAKTWKELIDMIY